MHCSEFWIICEFSHNSIPVIPGTLELNFSEFWNFNIATIEGLFTKKSLCKKNAMFEEKLKTFYSLHTLQYTQEIYDHESAECVT